MKKIVFVQKQENKYDPVAAFFGKKNPSQSKPTNQNTTVIGNTADKKKLMTGIPMPDKRATLQSKITDFTPKTDKKIETQPRGYPTKQQALKTRDLSHKNIKKQSVASEIEQKSVRNIVKEDKKQYESKKEAQKVTLHLQEQKQVNILKSITQVQQKPERQKNQNNNKIVKQFQIRQQQYFRKIEQLQSYKQKYVKNEQKLTKLQKDYKALLQKSKESQKIGEQLKQKQSQIKQMLQGNTIPFNRKRQVILSNKLRELKRINRQLVLRLKSYKGTDLVQLAIQQNRQEIMKQLYTVDVENEINREMYIQMQSLVAQLAYKLNNYLQLRNKQKGQKLVWTQEQFFLMEIIKLSQKISLNYINKYQVCPLPKSNEEAISTYSLLEQYKKREQIQKALEIFDVNLSLSAQNSEILNQIQESKSQLVGFRQQLMKPKRKKQINDKLKFSEYLEVYEKRANFIEILLVQNLFQLEFIREWSQKVHKKLQQSLQEFSKTLSQIKDIVNLGATGKQSLFFYLQNNIEKLLLKFPNIKQSIKQIQNNRKDIQRLCSFK